MADIYVTAETRDLGEHGWEAVAYAEKVYRVTAPTAAEVQAAFLTMWNETHETEYLVENVDFVVQT